VNNKDKEVIDEIVARRTLNVIMFLALFVRVMTFGSARVELFEFL